MIAIVKNDRRIAQPVVVQLLQYSPDLAIHLRDHVVILSPIVSHLRRIGMIGRQGCFGGIVMEFMRPGANLALVADGELKTEKNGMSSLGTLRTVGLSAGLIPPGIDVCKVVVGFAVVGAVVTEPSKNAGIQLHSVRNLSAASAYFGLPDWSRTCR